MSFLPIVERELRTAARKRGTFWLRVIAAFVAVIIGSGFLLLNEVAAFRRAPISLGLALFTVLTGLSLAAALLAGVFFTSDSLSEEKREGTLGFLFLTDLRGFDVVLGKLLSGSLRSFSALLAIFPILAATLLMGGVTGAHFWKALLALVNAMFVSLTAGLFISAISRDAQKALAGTLLLLVALVAGGPLFDALFVKSPISGFVGLSLSSPIYLYGRAGSSNPDPFWWSLLANQVVGWLLLGWACWLVPRTWQEKVQKTAHAKLSVADRGHFSEAPRRRALRSKLMDLNPVLWLACRDRWQSSALRVIAILLALGFVVMLVSNKRSLLWTGWSGCVQAFFLFSYLGIASQASRLFVTAHRQGLLELLLTTPMSSRQIVQGQWRGLLRMFFAPLALCLGMQFIGTLLLEDLSSMGFNTAAPPSPTAPATNSTLFSNSTTTVGTVTIKLTTSNAVTVGGSGVPQRLAALVISLTGLLVTFADFAALSWFGMWMGLSSRTTNRATLKTIAFVLVIPWFAVTFSSILLVPLLMLSGLLSGIGGRGTSWAVWYPVLISGLTVTLYATKDVIFVLWSRRRLYNDLRSRAAGARETPRKARPSPATSAILPVGGT